MILSFVIQVLLRKDKSIIEKFQELKSYYQYYRNLTRSLKEGTFYHFINEKNSIAPELIHKIINFEVVQIYNNLINDVKKSLEKVKVKENLNFSQHNDFIQVGFGGIFLNKPIDCLWTTGKFTFYMPTKKGMDNYFKIEFFSIPPIKCEIGFEGVTEKKFELGMLSTKMIKMKIESSKIKRNISELYITTDKFWSSSKILAQEKTILLGVGVKSVSNLSFYSG